MLKVVFRALVDSGESAQAPGADSEVIGVVKCVPSKVAPWPFTQREREAGICLLPNAAEANGLGEGEGESTASDADPSTRPRAAAPLGLKAWLMHKPLWNPADPQAQHNWDEVLMPQLRERLDALQDDLMRGGAWSASVVEQRPWLGYPSLDMVIDPYTINVPNSGNGQFGDVKDALQVTRILLAEGAIPANTVRIETKAEDAPWTLVAVDGTRSSINPTTGASAEVSC